MAGTCYFREWRPQVQKPAKRGEKYDVFTILVRLELRDRKHEGMVLGHIKMGLANHSINVPFMKKGGCQTVGGDT